MRIKKRGSKRTNSRKRLNLKDLLENVESAATKDYGCNKENKGIKQ